MIIRLTCSDARVIELVGIKLRGNAWSWFQRSVGNRLYGNDPPTWEMFKQELMDEFMSPLEREKKAFQFERLKQTFNMSMSEYAQEFIRLSRYAMEIIPIETARIKRFKSGLITPLYTTLVATEFPTLS